MESLNKIKEGVRQFEEIAGKLHEGISEALADKDLLDDELGMAEEAYHNAVAQAEAALFSVKSRTKRKAEEIQEAVKQAEKTLLFVERILGENLVKQIIKRITNFFKRIF